MKILNGVGDFFALDIGTNSIRLAQLDGDIQHGWSLQRYGYVPVDPKIIQDSSELGKKKLGEIIANAIGQAGIRTKNIALGMPAQKTFTTVVEVEAQNAKELDKIVRYQMDQYIPMAVEEAKADYAVLGVSPNDPAKAEVLISSTSNEYSESMLEMIESLGLNVIAQEPEPLAMARSLMPLGVDDARMIVDLGEKSTDIVVVYKHAPRLVRSISGGLEALIKTVAFSLNITEEQARQFILKFGLAQDKVEGQVFKALDGVLESFAGELSKSVRFFQTKYSSSNLGGIILSGFAELIPFFAEYIEVKTGVATTQGNPWQLVRVTPEQQKALMNVASEFAVVIGLAERSNK